MSITLYYTPMSSSDSVHWAIEELGIPYHKVKVNLQAGDQKKPEFVKLNPNAKVPTLVEDDSPMFESLAMIIHLGQKYGRAKGLWPHDESLEQAQALAWSTWGMATLGSKAFSIYANTSERYPAEQKNAAQAEAAHKDIKQSLQILENHLQNRLYILGSTFSLADIPVASSIWFASYVQVDLSEFPNIQEWLKRCTERPARAKLAD